ncbi:hypothetical protein, partial [Pseudoalteromonas mariniglutinosa]|uniref:hypothetical protein n=1 Tax=Pseudoalteromonas mariniglutinosa TaxID=206042 RepID=UPI001F31CDD9
NSICTSAHTDDCFILLKSYTGYPVAIKALGFISLGLRMLRFPIFLSTLNFKLSKKSKLKFYSTY